MLAVPAQGPARRRDQARKAKGPCLGTGLSKHWLPEQDSNLRPID